MVASNESNSLLSYPDDLDLIWSISSPTSFSTCHSLSHVKKSLYLCAVSCFSHLYHLSTASKYSSSNFLNCLLKFSLSLISHLVFIKYSFSSTSFMGAVRRSIVFIPQSKKPISAVPFFLDRIVPSQKYLCSIVCHS